VSTNDYPEHAGFLKEAGVAKLVGRGLKSVGRALGHSGLEAKGFKMQHGGVMGDTIKSPSRLRPRSKPSTPKVQLVVPRDASKAQREVLSGASKAQQKYIRPHGTRRSI